MSSCFAKQRLVMMNGLKKVQKVCSAQFTSGAPLHLWVQWLQWALVGAALASTLALVGAGAEIHPECI